MEKLQIQLRNFDYLTRTFKNYKTISVYCVPRKGDILKLNYDLDGDGDEVSCMFAVSAVIMNNDFGIEVDIYLLGEEHLYDGSGFSSLPLNPTF